VTVQTKAVTVERARLIAVEAARFHWSDAVVNDVSRPFLSDVYLEAEHCWMFFRNDAIVTPPERALDDCAYVVSKRGHLRYVVNYAAEPQKADAYNKKMSEYFAAHNL
jgi:hypothetical protein